MYNGLGLIVFTVYGICICCKTINCCTADSFAVFPIVPGIIASLMNVASLPRLVPYGQRKALWRDGSLSLFFAIGKCYYLSSTHELTCS